MYMHLVRCIDIYHIPLLYLTNQFHPRLRSWSQSIWSQSSEKITKKHLVSHQEFRLGHEKITKKKDFRETPDRDVLK